MSHAEENGTPVRQPPRCRCGFEPGHHMVSAEEEYSLWSSLVIATGISQKPLRIRHRCRRCGEQVGEPVERPRG